MRPIYEMEVIATGDEIVFGQLVDTNSSWIARLSTEQGAHVRRLTCVGDDIEDIVKAVDRSLSEGTDLIVITGGLGPSEDDLTIEALAKASGRKVVYDERTLKMLETNCRAASVALTEHRRKMARSVEGSEPLENPLGLAPGLRMKLGHTILVALPGIPKEMKPMFERCVIPLISRATFKRAAAMKLNVLMPYYSTFPILNRLRIMFPDAYIKTHSKPPSHEKAPELVYGLAVDVLVWAENGGDCEARLNEVASSLTELVEDKGGRVKIEKVEIPNSSDDPPT